MVPGFFFFLNVLKNKENTREGLGISPLPFFDDNLVFYETSHPGMIYLSLLIMWFEFISCLKININNGELILVKRMKNLEGVTMC